MDDARTRAVLTASYRTSGVVAAIVAVFAYFDPYTPTAVILGIVTGVVFVMATAGMVRRIGERPAPTRRAFLRPVKVIHGVKLFIAAAAMYLIWRWLPDRLVFFAAGYTVPMAALLAASLTDALRDRKSEPLGVAAKTNSHLNAQVSHIEKP